MSKQEQYEWQQDRAYNEREEAAERDQAAYEARVEEALKEIKADPALVAEAVGDYYYGLAEDAHEREASMDKLQALAAHATSENKYYMNGHKIAEMVSEAVYWAAEERAK